MDIPFWVAIPVVALFIPITAIVADAWRTVREKEHEHRERLKAIEMGLVDALPTPSAKTEIAKPGSRNGSGRNPGLHGAVWTGLGVGLLLSTILVQQMSDNEGMVTFANFLMLWSFPSLGVGVGLLLFTLVGKKQHPPGAGGA